MTNRFVSTLALAIATAVSIPHSAKADPVLPQGVTRVPVTFTEGHDTVGEDRGRPIILIAAALGVTPEVFRDAFSRVHPAGVDSGGPTQDEARKNKQALMSVLAKYGITNDRLDTVSNYYRYARSHDELWTNKPAVANALVKNGSVISYELVDGGAGYSSTPNVSVAGVNNPPAKIDIAYGKKLETNGKISALTVSK